MHYTIIQDVLRRRGLLGDEGAENYAYELLYTAIAGFYSNYNAPMMAAHIRRELEMGFIGYKCIPYRHRTLGIELVSYDDWLAEQADIVDTSTDTVDAMLRMHNLHAAMRAAYNELPRWCKRIVLAWAHCGFGKRTVPAIAANTSASSISVAVCMFRIELSLQLGRRCSDNGFQQRAGDNAAERDGGARRAYKTVIAKEVR